MVSAIKVNLIKILQGFDFDGMPKAQRQQHHAVIERLKEPDIVITKDQCKQIRLFLAAMVCGVKWPNIPMTDGNKKQFESAEEWLKTLEAKTPTPKKKNR